MKITRVEYDWFYSSIGEEYQSYAVGKRNVVEIKEHKALGEGDKWFYDVIFEDGSMERIFNPNRVFYEPVQRKTLSKITHDEFIEELEKRLNGKKYKTKYWSNYPKSIFYYYEDDNEMTREIAAYTASDAWGIYV